MIAYQDLEGVPSVCNWGQSWGHSWVSECQWREGSGETWSHFASVMSQFAHSYSYPAHLEELLRQLAEVLYDVGQHDAGDGLTAAELLRSLDMTCRWRRSVAVAGCGRPAFPIQLVITNWIWAAPFETVVCAGR